ncbi:DUF5992 family protein [Microbulbifer sp. 2205BS26-8]|uniref:DUF5992 family protein n=1 Tax=Microbulbifer sp. 2205BS26-8 TaxID=3064386 RepID=UPI00273F1FAB|nr:DUF5992 family protein [Microbulbifer sp. 2205BS26-8]MDP5209832.1 DUF5992 family protein [Microbulbifer sp. 2205BS26-8]
MKKYTTAIFFVLAISTGFFSSQAFSDHGYVAKTATVTKITSTSSGQDAFWVYYTDATDDQCSGKVKFDKSLIGTTGSFERSFTLATTALVSGNRISIYSSSYTDVTDCLSALSVFLLK